MRIDAHQHFWALGGGSQAWPTPEMTAIYRDFAPTDLAPLLHASGIDGTVLVQAAPNLAETHLLLDIATRVHWVKGVVGWVDFDAADAAMVIADLAQNPALKGLRPMVQDMPDDRWLLGAHLAPAFEAMARHGLVLDALVLPRHLAVLGALLARHPGLRVVIDHAAKPDIAGNDLDHWATAIGDLARTTGALCKVSGLWTQGGGDTSAALYKPYVDHLLASFGPQRLLWGSDWPVLRLAGDYAAWFDQCRALTSHCEPVASDAIFGGNARRLYGLD